MAKELKGDLQGQGLHIAIVVSHFNDFVTRRLLEGAQEGLQQHGVGDEDVVVARVPGSLELSLAAKTLAKTGQYDAVVCLGAVIQGETGHYKVVAEQTAAGISRVALEVEVPIIFGVLTTDNVEQAINRAGGKLGNRGYDAALSAIQMGRLMRKLKELQRG